MLKTPPENPEIQDIDEMARQIDEALAEARLVIENLPAQGARRDNERTPCTDGRAAVGDGRIRRDP